MSGRSADADYVCSLDAASIKKAQSELGEIPEDRLAAVQALREWIETQKHISFDKTDTVHLLCFLRAAKFSQLRAREMIVSNLQLKNQAPSWFENVDVKDPEVVALMDAGYVIPLPKRHPDGSTIVLQKIGGLNPSIIHIDGICRAASVMLHYLSQDEMTQVNGVTFIMDCSNVTNKTALKLLKPDFAKWNKMWQKNQPGRFKAFNYYNAGVIMEIGLVFFKACLSKKYFERLHVFDTAEGLYTKIPKECLPLEYLPDDYEGPTIGEIPTILNEFKKKIYSAEFRRHLLYHTGVAFSVEKQQDKVNKHQKSEGVPAQHYRKLVVD